MTPRLVPLALAAGILAASAAPAIAQRTLTRADSALVGRILMAEDRRDSASTALRDGARHRDARIRVLARRARARIVDPRFAARDSLPAPAPAPAYREPEWAARYRLLKPDSTNCEPIRRAVTDPSWHVAIRAMDLLSLPCRMPLEQWVDLPVDGGSRTRLPVSWQPAAHAFVAMARTAPDAARPRLPRFAEHRVPWMRMYAARAAEQLRDTATLERLALDSDDNVKEVAIDALARVAGHSADETYARALRAGGYQAVRSAARALRGTANRDVLWSAAVPALRRITTDSSETSRDARLAILEAVGSLGESVNFAAFADYARDFDCEVARAAARVAHTTARCTPLAPVPLPKDAVSLALGREVRLRVTMADSSGGGSFVVRLRGDVAPIMSARILDLVRAGWYDGRAWYRVEPNFVIQGLGPGANEYVGHPRFLRDELGAIPHPRGTVGMSTRGHDTGDAQWFINLRDNARLTRDYTVFGEVIEGIDVVDGIVEGDVIAHIRIL